MLRESRYSFIAYGLKLNIIVATVCCLSTAPAAAQTIQIVDSLPKDYNGQIAEAYDIRLMAVSGDGSTIGGFISPVNLPAAHSTSGTAHRRRAATNHFGLYNETFPDVFDPIIIRGNEIIALPVNPADGYQGGAVIDLSYDGSVAVGVRKIGDYVQSGYTRPAFQPVGWFSESAVTPLIEAQGLAWRTDATGQTIVGGTHVPLQFGSAMAFAWTGGQANSDPSYTAFFGISADATVMVHQVDDYLLHYTVSANAEYFFSRTWSGGTCYNYRPARVNVQTGAQEILMDGTGCGAPIFWDSNHDGTLAIGTHDLTYFDVQWCQPEKSYVWTETHGTEMLSEHFLRRGIDIWQYAGCNGQYGGIPIVTAVSNDGNTFAGIFWKQNNKDVGWVVRLDNDPAPPCGSADFNCDGVVDVSDLLMLLSAWGPCPPNGDCLGDINNDGVVDVSDLLMLLSNWG